MAFVRYRSPDDPAFAVFGVSRFRVDHAVFLLPVGPLRAQIAATLGEYGGWNLEAMKLDQEARRLESCLGWLDTVGDDPDLVVVPDLVHEPAIDVVADRLIGVGEFERAYCPSCEAEYRPPEVAVEPWAFEEDGVTVRGRRSTCPGGHTIHATTDEIEMPGLESPDDD